MKIIIYYNLIVDHHDLKTRDLKKNGKRNLFRRKRHPDNMTT